MSLLSLWLYFLTKNCMSKQYSKARNYAAQSSKCVKRPMFIFIQSLDRVLWSSIVQLPVECSCPGLWTKVLAFSKWAVQNKSSRPAFIQHAYCVAFTSSLFLLHLANFWIYINIIPGIVQHVNYEFSFFSPKSKVKWCRTTFLFVWLVTFSFESFLPPYNLILWQPF